MSIPDEVWNAAWQGNRQDDEQGIHPDLEKPPVNAQLSRAKLLYCAATSSE